MQTWAFFDGDGNSITRGWQGTEEQARKLAKRKAADGYGTVEFIAESDLAGFESGEDEEPPTGETVSA